MDQPGQSGLQTARIIATVLAGGVVFFWIVGWVLTGGGEEGIAPDTIPAEVALWVLIGALIAGFAGALIFRGRAMGPVERSSREDRDLAPRELAAVQTHLIISWALLEAPALLSGVLFLLMAESLLLGLAVPVYALGVFMTFPRSEWFGDRGLHRAHVERGE